MNNTLRITLIVVSILFGAAILVTGGIFIGQNFAGRFGSDQYTESFMQRFGNFSRSFGMGPEMMRRGFFSRDNRNFNWGNSGQSFGMRPGMMGRSLFNRSNRDSNWDQSGQPFGMGPGMMGRGFTTRENTGKPVTIDQAKTAFDNYLANLGNDDLEVHEIMVFSQNVYAVITERSTGMAAMELLLDHNSQEIFPEYGPNHMWNLKYGMMTEGCGSSIGTGCGSGFTSKSGDVKDFEEMSVNLEDAKVSAQNYLENTIPGAQVASEGFTFYGYYTFDYEQDGKPAGMLSVNGYTGYIWPHTWHGQFIEEAEFE